MVVVVLPSPAGVGLIAVTRISRPWRAGSPGFQFRPGQHRGGQIIFVTQQGAGPDRGVFSPIPCLTLGLSQVRQMIRQQTLVRLMLRPNQISHRPLP